MQPPKRVLFLCVANSARSQMAEAWARHMFGQLMTVLSAGSQPTQVHPLSRQVMQEVGISLDHHRSTSVAAIDPQSVDLVITLCADEVCPAPLAQVPHLHWPIADPARPAADDATLLAQFRQAREEIRSKLERWAARA